MKQYKLTGGARIGRGNASYPLAELTVTENQLKINATLIGNLVFAPKDIISIEAYQVLPVFGKGIKINHRVSEYKDKVIFWTWKNPETVINEIKQTGFLENLNPMTNEEEAVILLRQSKSGFPLKKSVLITVVLIWNLLFIIEVIKIVNQVEDGVTFGTGIKLAVTLVLGFSVLTLFSKSFQRFILKEGRELDEIKKALYLIIAMCCFFLFNLFFLWNIH